ncbi:MAG: hypothetical protein ACRDY0_05410 [Acidimicrobiales bacterium]
MTWVLVVTLVAALALLGALGSHLVRTSAALRGAGQSALTRLREAEEAARAAGHDAAGAAGDGGGDGRSAGGDGQAAGGDGQAAGGDGQAAGGDGQAAGGDGQAAGGDGQAARLASLWSLALLEADRSWRLTMAMPRARDDQPPQTLGEALAAEVERTREETGTPGSLLVGSAVSDSPEQSVVVLAVVKGLLAAVARHCGAFDLEVLDAGGAAGETDAAGEASGDGPGPKEPAGMVIGISCEGFDGSTALSDDVAGLVSALEPCRAGLELAPLDAGCWRARLTLPDSI